MSVQCTRTLLAAALLALAVAKPAAATWQLYGAGDFGYSIALADVSGSSDLIPSDFAGSDDDSSPLMSVAVGVQVPLSELTPWRGPDWPVRFDIEFAGLREYRLATVGQTSDPLDNFHTTVSSWSMLTNIWLDLPLGGLYGPITSTTRLISGRDRLPSLRDFLRASTFYLGVGIGFSNLAIETNDSTLLGANDGYNFAYQVGTGFGYQWTERMNLGIGYRYFQPGSGNLILRGTTGVEHGDLELEADVHEVRFSLRILLYDLPDRWR